MKSKFEFKFEIEELNIGQQVEVPIPLEEKKIFKLFQSTNPQNKFEKPNQVQYIYELK